MNMAAQIIVTNDVTVRILCHILMSLFKCNVIYRTLFQIMIALAGYMGRRRTLYM